MVIGFFLEKINAFLHGMKCKQNLEQIGGAYEPVRRVCRHQDRYYKLMIILYFLVRLLSIEDFTMHGPEERVIPSARCRIFFDNLKNRDANTTQPYLNCFEHHIW